MAFWERRFSSYFLWEDKDRHVVRTTLHLGDSFGGSDGENAAQKTEALVPLMQALSDCHIIGYGTTVRFVQKDIEGAGEAERRGNFVFSTKYGVLMKTSVPGFDPACCYDSGRSALINPDDIDAKDFIKAVIDGPLGGKNGCVAANGEQLHRLKDAYKYHRNSLMKRGRRQS